MRQFAHLETILKQHAENVCAVIIELLVQCAGSMRMYDPIYLTLLREASDKYCEQGAISPDFLCPSKGLTGGYLPLSAVLTTDKIYDAFYDNYTSQKAFLHTHRYTGNALVCRTALATLTIFEKQNVLEKNTRLAAKIAELSKRFMYTNTHEKKAC